MKGLTSPRHATKRDKVVKGTTETRTPDKNSSRQKLPDLILPDKVRTFSFSTAEDGLLVKETPPPPPPGMLKKGNVKNVSETTSSKKRFGIVPVGVNCFDYDSMQSSYEEMHVQLTVYALTGVVRSHDGRYKSKHNNSLRKGRIKIGNRSNPKDLLTQCAQKVPAVSSSSSCPPPPPQSATQPNSSAFTMSTSSISNSGGTRSGESPNVLKQREHHRNCNQTTSNNPKNQLKDNSNACKVGQPDIPTTAVVSVHTAFAHESGFALETFLPSLQLQTKAVTAPSESGHTHVCSAFWSSRDHDSTCPGQHKTIPTTLKSPKETHGPDSHPTFEMIRRMQRESFENRDQDVRSLSTFVHKRVDINVSIGRGKELLPLGVASIVITGDEESFVIHHVPIQPISSTATAGSYNHANTPTSTPFPSNVRRLQRKNKAKGYRSCFASEAQYIYTLGESATLKIGVRVIPATTNLQDQQQSYPSATSTAKNLERTLERENSEREGKIKDQPQTIEFNDEKSLIANFLKTYAAFDSEAAEENDVDDDEFEDDDQYDYDEISDISTSFMPLSFDMDNLNGMKKMGRFFCGVVDMKLWQKDMQLQHYDDPDELLVDNENKYSGEERMGENSITLSKHGTFHSLSKNSKNYRRTGSRNSKKITADIVSLSNISDLSQSTTTDTDTESFFRSLQRMPLPQTLPRH